MTDGVGCFDRCASASKDENSKASFAFARARIYARPTHLQTRNEPAPARLLLLRELRDRAGLVREHGADGPRRRRLPEAALEDDVLAHVFRLVDDRLRRPADRRRGHALRAGG
jgi:hypothetical protein